MTTLGIPKVFRLVESVRRSLVDLNRSGGYCFADTGLKVGEVTLVEGNLGEVYEVKRSRTTYLVGCGCDTPRGVEFVEEHLVSRVELLGRFEFFRESLVYHSRLVVEYRHCIVRSIRHSEAAKVLTDYRIGQLNRRDNARKALLTPFKDEERLIRSEGLQLLDEVLLNLIEEERNGVTLLVYDIEGYRNQEIRLRHNLLSEGGRLENPHNRHSHERLVVLDVVFLLPALLALVDDVLNRYIHITSPRTLSLHCCRR